MDAYTGSPGTSFLVKNSDETKPRRTRHGTEKSAEQERRMVFAGQDAWRKHPMLTNCYKRAFPGFGVAVGIFAGYCVLDQAAKYAFGERRDDRRQQIDASRVKEAPGGHAGKRSPCPSSPEGCQQYTIGN